MTLDALRHAVAESGRHLASLGLCPGTAGNLSARSGVHVAVTATGAVLAELTAEQVTVVDLDGRPVAGALAPTSELDLHLGVYRSTPAGAVVHTHAPFCTTVGLVADALPVVHYQLLELGGAIRVAPFAVFGTPALSDAVLHALEGRKAALMANHGAIAWGADLRSAVDAALLLEWGCELYWRARAIGEPRVLSPAQQAAVAEHAAHIGYGATRPRGSGPPPSEGDGA